MKSGEIEKRWIFNAIRLLTFRFILYIIFFI